MLVSTIQNKEHGYVDLQVKNILSEVNEEEELGHFHQDLTNKRTTNEDKNWSNGLFFSEYCNSLLKRYKLTSQNILTHRTRENGGKENYVDDNSKSGEVQQSTRKLAVELEWDSDEGNNPVKMVLKNEYSFCPDNRPYPTRFSPETNGSPSNQDSSNLDPGLDNYRGPEKISSNPGLPGTSRNNPKETKMHISTDDDTNFDIFDFMKCSDDEAADCSKSYCDKDDLTLNEDLVNKYEKNLGLDIVKDKDICWAAGNFDSEVCPLNNYDICNESSLMNFVKESPDGESRESFSQEWVFDENIDYVSQERIPDHHVIVPKKTVDITKIKGWRKKQFTVEKCLANKNSLLKKTNLRSDLSETGTQREEESGATRAGEEQNKDYAFVCDKLDDFLNQEAELKINYEIPHLYAEYGIKLTSEELVSRPKFKLSTVSNSFPVAGESKNNLPQKPEIVPFPGRIKTEDNEILRTSLTKKPSPKSKCAFPNKSHKNWSLWKENNLSKGKPISLFKKEPTAEIPVPCRRSDRISQAALNKSNTSVGPAVKERRSLLGDRDDIEIVEDVKPGTTVSNPNFDFGTEYSYQIKKYGVVLYPGPSAPLNPFITYHLQKIRSYRTLIDKKWANFAVSVVVQKGKTENRKRMILPVTCCFKYKNEGGTALPAVRHLMVENLVDNDSTTDVKPTDKNLADERRQIPRQGNLEEKQIGERIRFSERRRQSVNRFSVDSAITKKINGGKFDLGEEEMKNGGDVKDEIELVNVTPNGFDHMKNSDDSNFDSKCDIVFEKRRSKISIRNCIKENLRNSPEVIDIEDDDTEMGSTVHLSPDVGQTAFNKVIAKLLTKKLNELKQTDNVTSSIDNLKTVKLNALELIKLNFIKENYLSGYINLWYMKSPDTGKSRVFLTFSMSPPVEGAINLKMMSRNSESEPPNIIQEIITKDKFFDPNDLAILYCDGKHWEIHGSVNFAMDKNYSEIKGGDQYQVFHLTKKVFPELVMLHDIKQKSDKNKVLKWWVMHMMQDYTEITVRYGDKIGRISRSIIIKTWKTKVPSFIEFKGLDSSRPIGVGVNPRLWPYFLIGPYYMGDHHNLTLKLNSKIVPFEYYLPLDRVKPAFLLKRFVSSVIMHSWRNCRQVVGMWLYDRIAMRQSSFIQVRTRVKKSGSYEPSIEHDYSLCKTPDGSFESRMDCNLPAKRVSDKNNHPPTEVYLVPDVPHLGYIKGELHPDQSITIEHPLKPDRRRNSHRIGDWLNRIMRKRVKFYPNDFCIKWKVVKNADLIRNLQPLDRSALGGTHILCQKGIFYLLSLTNEKIAKLGLDKNVVMDAILNNPIIQEVVEVKELGKILLGKDSCDLPISDVLQMALYEIEKLEKENKSLIKSRAAIAEKRASLCRKFLKALDGCDIDDNSKRTIDFYVSGMLEARKTNEGIMPDPKREKENVRRLEAINKFLENVRFSASRNDSEKRESFVDTGNHMKDAADVKISRRKRAKDKTEEITIDEEPEDEKLRELELKIKTLHECLSQMNEDDGSLREKLAERLNAMSEHLEKMKRNHNNNGKLSPVLGGSVSSAAEPSHCQTTNTATKIIKGEKVESDESLVGRREEGDSLEAPEKINEVEENNNESCPSDDSVTEKKPGENPSPKIQEKRSTDEDLKNPQEEAGGRVDSNAIEEISIDEPEAEPDRSKTPQCNGLTEGNRHKTRNNRIILKTSRNSCKMAERKLFGSMGKRVRLKLLRRNSSPDGKGSGRFNGRIGYVDGKRVIFVNNKRKRDGHSDFIKKLRTS